MTQYTKLVRKLMRLRDRLIQCASEDEFDSCHTQDAAHCVNGAIFAVNAAMEFLTTKDRDALIKALDNATSQLGQVRPFISAHDKLPPPWPTRKV